MAYRKLELTLVSARDLKNVKLIMRMDVYAVVTISGDTLTRQFTKPDPYGGRNPRWDATLQLAVPPTAAEAAGSCLHVLLRAARVLGDRDIGEVVIPLADLLAGAPAEGPQQPRVASYQVRKVHRWEPRGVLHVSYRLGPVDAPVEDKSPPPVMGTVYPSSQPFQPQAHAYQPPPAHPRPAAKAAKHDPTQVFMGPTTQIILGGGGGGPPATATTMSSSPTGSNVSSPRKPYGAWPTKQEELHHNLHHDHYAPPPPPLAAAAHRQRKQSSMESKTTEVFGVPEPGYYRIYYVITNPQDLEKALAENYPVVLMFWAKWNEPCKVMMRPYWDLAKAKRNQAVFCRVDVDKFKDLVEGYRVEALPTFVLFKNGKEQHRVVGAKVEELNTIIKNNI